MNIFNVLNKYYPYDFKISLLDIGARDNLQWPWENLNKEILDVHLFEPEENEMNNLKKTSPSTFNIHNHLLSDKKENIYLNLNKSLGTSSINEPNFDFLKHFTDYERFNLAKKVEFQSTTLDKLYNDNFIPKTDFAKIDTQGSELKILHGGKSYFKNLLAIEVEVNFASIYVNQCYFSDVDDFIRNKLKLTLWDLKTIDWKYANGAKNSYNKKGQIIFGDALYLKSMDQLDEFIKPLDKVLKRIAVIKIILISLIYGFIDYAISLLKNSDFNIFLYESDMKYLNNAIDQLNKYSITSKKGNKILYYIFYIFSEIFKQSYNNSNRSKRTIGSEKIGNFWL